MNKRYRFFLILLVLGLCFIFLLPSIRWYFMTSTLDQTRALGSREEIRTYSLETAMMQLADLMVRARNGEDLPEDLDFLVPIARRAYRDAGLRAPDVMDARAVLRTFAPSELAQELALSTIESHHRDTILGLKDLQRNAVQLGLDLSGGLSIILQANTPGRNLTDDDVERTLEILNNRIDRFGLTEPTIRRQGQNQIYIEIPGSADPERINDIIMGRGSLAFHIVDTEATAAFNAYYRANSTNTLFDEYGELLDPNIVPGDVIIRGVYDRDQYGLEVQQHDAGLYIYQAISREVGLDGNYIQDVNISRGNIDGRPTVNFQLTSEGGEIFYRLTSANVGRPMAIVLDGRVRSVATINSAIRDSGQITGFGAEEANNIANILRTAALPVELEVMNQQSIGATLGADTINQGMTALLYGLVAVFVFLILYYKSAGINAVIAQLLNFYIMFSILSAFNFTITLPSIAGFILTIGMATDANVIIFERMKEELRMGKNRKAAIEMGFNKAFWAIMDANITTFIAAMFLSQLGTGPIRGFAVCLAIGVFSSVFTALFVSRLIFDFSTDVLKSKKLSVSWFIK